MSLAHSNSSHSLYVALGASPASVEGLHVPRSGLSPAPASEHKRDWILLPVTFKQLKQVFRQAIKSFNKTQYFRLRAEREIKECYESVEREQSECSRQHSTRTD